MRALNHDEFLALRRFSGLDGLRAIAATIVIFFHFGGASWSWLSGWVGVYIFFVLSGFLITTLLLREQDRVGRISLPNFYIRRVFRILPPYLVILGGIVAFLYLRGEFFTRELPTALPYYLSFLNEFLPEAHPTLPNNFFSGSWTLGIEEKFYLFWPFLLVIIGVGAAKKKLVLVFCTLAATLALVPLTTGGWVINYSLTVLYESSMHYFILLVGCLLAILMHYRRTYRLIQPLTHPLVAVPGVLFFAVLHTNMTDLWAETRNNMWLFPVYAFAVALLLIALVGPGPLRWVLSTAPMRFVGERSYSLYLLQGPVHYLVELTIPQLQQQRTLTAVTVFVIALAIADLIHRWVEQPLINVGKGLIARKDERKARRAKAAATVEPEPLVPARVG